VGSSVKVHSSLTGLVVSTLSSVSASGQADISSADAGAHTDLITGILLSPENSFQLITSSLDGTIKVWDFMDGALLQTLDLAQPIYHVCAHASLKGYVFVAAGRPNKRTNKQGTS
jgi:NET1-associated nuclear protein 1 (U3 small nucleolar RNA-associated protein 17)